ncbi:hypothetical protein [Bradyrhizobium genosp. P]|uniref:hypothetical protein n=1 Tax=Bradyrhizobium genosp. P TaxID=83641 RepID=UPI003CF022C7
MIAQDSSEHIVLLLPSGQMLKVHGIRLYPADELAKIAAMRAEAAKGLGGVSTGLGFIGSPEWVFGASAVLGFLESALSETSKKTAIRLLAQADVLKASTISRGQLFRISEIDRIDQPAPKHGQEMSRDRRQSTSAGCHFMIKKNFSGTTNGPRQMS